jgi:multiple sugar transport system substrate-binding protein
MMKSNDRPRRSAVVGVIAAALLGTLATAGATVAASPEPEPLTGSGTVRVVVGSWWDRVYDDLVAKWAEDHPEITLELIPTPNSGYVEAFTSSVLAGSPPDVIDLSSRAISTVASQGLLQPIDDLVAHVDVSDIAPGVFAAGQFEGQQVALPSRSSAMILYYNKDVFDKAAVPYPTDDWTYEDLVQICQDLTMDDQFGVGISADLSDPGAAMNWLLPMVWAHGGDVLTEDLSEAATTTDEFKQGLALWTGLYTTHKCAPEGTPVFNFPRDLAPMFTADRLGIIASDGSGATQLADLGADNWGIVMMPNNQSKATGWLVGVPTGAANPDAAKVFIDWLLTTDVQSTVTPEPPALFSAMKSPKWDNETTALTAKAGAEANARPDPPSPYWNAIANAVLTEAQKVLVGDLTVDEAAETMKTEIDGIIAAGG